MCNMKSAMLMGQLKEPLKKWNFYYNDANWKIHCVSLLKLFHITLRIWMHIYWSFVNDVYLFLGLQRLGIIVTKILEHSQLAVPWLRLHVRLSGLLDRWRCMLLLLDRDGIVVRTDVAECKAVRRPDEAAVPVCIWIDPVHVIIWHSLGW